MLNEACRLDWASVGWRDVLKRSLSRSGPDWAAWASEHGYRYDAPAPDLAGRFWPTPTDRRHAEEYLYSVRGTHGSLEFVLFNLRTPGSGRAGSATYRYTLYLAVQLPRRPRADLRAMTPEAAFKAVGGSLGGRFGFDEWQDNWMLGGGHGVAEFFEVETLLQHIDNQIALAPPEIWEG